MPKKMMPIKDLKPYVIDKAEDGKSAKVNLYGEVVETVPTDYWTGEKIDGLFIELNSFLKEVETLSDMDDVSFYINSVGGDVYAGVSIFNKIRAMKAHTTTIVDGLAASAASIIAQAGDDRKVCIGSQVMIHCAASLLWGYYNKDDLKEVTNHLKGVDKAIAEIYADRTGRTEADVLTMMSKTTWMTSKEAVEEGFADEQINASELEVAQISNSTTYVVNGIPHSFNKIPLPTFNKVGQIKMLSGSEPVNINTIPKEEEKMNLQELKAKYPDLVNQIAEEAVAAAQTEKDEAVKNAVADAVKAERERMQEIDSIAKTIGSDLVNDAKYVNPVSAKDLAFKAMQNQAEKGSDYLNQRAEEQAASNVNNVTADPVSGSQEDSTAKDINDGAALLNAWARK